MHHIYRYANSLRRLKEGNQANNLILNFYKNQDSLVAFRKFEKEITDFDSIQNVTDYQRYTIENLEINSKNSDFAPVVYNEDLIFTSARESSTKANYSWNNQPFLSQYRATQIENDKFAMPVKIVSDMGTSFHEATLAVMPNDSTVFFSANSKRVPIFGKNNTSKNYFKLYRGVFNDGEISQVAPLYFNSNFYSVGHPTISKDGRFLFFASDMPNGYGSADIYYVEIFEDGNLGTFKNAGPLVNTFGNDFFPHLKDDTLYFSSDGHIGYGGLDVFKVNFDRTMVFSGKQNLGQGFNTNYDDFSIHFETDRKGYFASNRPNGKGDDDIYSFSENFDAVCKANYTLKVYELLDKTPISNSQVSIIDAYGDMFGEIETDSLGEATFTMPCQDTFTLKVRNSLYEPETAIKTDFKSSLDNEWEHTVFLYRPDSVFVKGKDDIERLKLKPIYFDLDQWEITESAKEVLNRVVEVMTAFSNMVLKIESHTDSRGSTDHNLLLSNKRAIATNEYIISRGIAPERIESAVGFGEYRLINECVDDMVCSKEKHLENRRSEFIVVKR